MDYNWRGHNGNFSLNHAWEDYLKLGKRHYMGDVSPPPPTKRGKAGGGGGAARCQVEGCEAALANAKDYHKRHKVCEMHAKAPKVVLLGIDQRFCQQCSRFHVMAEFDEAKRSCRRRLAGHNERRRKNSQEHTSFARRQYQDIKMVGAGRYPHPHLVNINNTGCVLSLLSPARYASRSALPAPDFSAMCSAALCELIAENRACRQLDATQVGNDCKIGPGWVPPEHRAHVTLNLMRGPDPAFGIISDHGHRAAEDDGGGDCSDLWKLPLGY